MDRISATTNAESTNPPWYERPPNYWRFVRLVFAVGMLLFCATSVIWWNTGGILYGFETVLGYLGYLLVACWTLYQSHRVFPKTRAGTGFPLAIVGLPLYAYQLALIVIKYM